MNAKELIKHCRIKSRLMDTGGVYNDVEVLDYLNHQMYSRVVPLYLSLSSNYFLKHQDALLSKDIKSSAIVCAIPNRAIHNKLQNVQLLNENSEESLVSTCLLDAINTDEFDKKGFFFESDRLVFRNVNDSTRVRLWYYRRPSSLTLNSALVSSHQILDNTNTLECICAEVPLIWSDTLAKNNNSGFKIYCDLQFRSRSGSRYSLNAEGGWSASSGVSEIETIEDVPINFINGATIFCDMSPLEDACVRALQNLLVDADRELIITERMHSFHLELPQEANYYLVLLTSLAFNLDESLIKQLKEEIAYTEALILKTSPERSESTPKYFVRKGFF